MDWPETCKQVIPMAKIIKAARKKGKAGTLDAGRNSKAPTAIVSKPNTIVRLYPIRSTSFPAGTANRK